MKSIVMMIFAVQALDASAAPTGPRLDGALQNYRAVVAGQRQLSDLTPRERADLMELDRWLHSRDAIRPSETEDQCTERLSSKSPTDLEGALVDLKCSQRPVG